MEEGKLPLVWEDGVQQIWDYFAEVTLTQREYQGRTAALKQALRAPVREKSYADLVEQISLLKTANATLNNEIRQLKETSAAWEELAGTRAEIIRSLRIELGRNLDNVDDEEY